MTEISLSIPNYEDYDITSLRDEFELAKIDTLRHCDGGDVDTYCDIYNMSIFANFNLSDSYLAELEDQDYVKWLRSGIIDAKKFMQRKGKKINDKVIDMMRGTAHKMIYGLEKHKIEKVAGNPCCS